MTDEQTTPNNYSTSDLEAAINSEDPRQAFVIALTLFQRVALALEDIAAAMNEPPTVLFEQAPTTDGLGEGLFKGVGHNDK